MPSVSRPDVRPCFRYCARCTPYFARAQRAQHAQRLRARAARKWEFYFARSRSILIRFSIAFSFAQDTVLLPSSDRFEAKFVHVQRETADKLLFNALTDPKVHQISSPRPCRRIPVDPARRHEKLGCLIVVVGRAPVDEYVHEYVHEWTTSMHVSFRRRAPGLRGVSSDERGVPVGCRAG